jgi:hypothetical protein
VFARSGFFGLWQCVVVVAEVVGQLEASKQSRPRVQGPHVNAGPIKRNPSLSDPYIPHSILPKSTLARGCRDV